MQEKSQLPNVLGMRHIALFVDDIARSLSFYVDLLGMAIEWRPDSDNVFLTSGSDNLALHKRVDPSEVSPETQRLDHFGFILAAPEDVDQWHEYMLANNVTIKARPKNHRDGSRSFYCLDPDGILIQMIFHPPISSK